MKVIQVRYCDSSFKPLAYDGAGRMAVAAVLLCVGICAKGETVTNLVERAVQNPTFSGDGQTATITVPSTVGAFVKAVIGFGIMCGERN